MKQKFLHREGKTPVERDEIKELEDLGTQINAFLASGVRLTFPPQLLQSNQDILGRRWYAALFYEQPSSPGINDHDRAQHSLTAEDVKRYEENNAAYDPKKDAVIAYERVSPPNRSQEPLPNSSSKPVEEYSLEYHRGIFHRSKQKK